MAPKQFRVGALRRARAAFYPLINLLASLVIDTAEIPESPFPNVRQRVRQKASFNGDSTR